jgi:hypothetical protein
VAKANPSELINRKPYDFQLANANVETSTRPHSSVVAGARSTRFLRLVEKPIPRLVA